ncbi:MAG: hypothetical protein J2P43_05995 [Candidatus Dormibacteraeota bacterium]|nr:hypothetical protein [Candidatus Dormibacteraeota bacterium]MBO0744550.1 hypothetical protein [Candidatus Dormibacteraeota bacterium]
MRRLLFVPALILVVVGIIFTLQGANVVRGSSLMSGHPLWEVVGIVFIVTGLVLAWFGAARGRRRASS